MNALAWFDAHTARAPHVLRERARWWVQQVDPALAPPASLAAAGRAALAHVTSRPGDRSIALDLLAADALITLALLASATTAPEALDPFAAALLPA